MSAKSSTDRAIEFIIQSDGVRTEAIHKRCDIPQTSVTALLAPYVRAGVLSTCKVTTANGRESNEYRAGPGVTLSNWRAHKVGVFSQAVSKPAAKRAPPPRRDEPKPPLTTISEAHALSRQIMTEASITPQAAAQGTEEPAQFAYWSDGRCIIDHNGVYLQLSAHDTKRLADFLFNAVVSREAA